MADNMILPGTGGTVAADVISDIAYQRVKLSFGADGAAADWDGTQHIGYVGGGGTPILVTPTLSTAGTYASGDFIGTNATPIDFAGAARINSGTGRITGASLIDYAIQSVPIELWVFSGSVTPPNDNAGWGISDAHSALCVGVIAFNTYYASTVNSFSVGNIPNGQLPFKAGAADQSIFGCLVNRGGSPVWANGDLTVRVYFDQD
jgi:hypothetical protein